MCVIRMVVHVYVDDVIICVFVYMCLCICVCVCDYVIVPQSLKNRLRSFSVA